MKLVNFDAVYFCLPFMRIGIPLVFCVSKYSQTTPWWTKCVYFAFLDPISLQLAKKLEVTEFPANRWRDCDSLPSASHTGNPPTNWNGSERIEPYFPFMPLTAAKPYVIVSVCDSGRHAWGPRETETQVWVYSASFSVNSRTPYRNLVLDVSCWELRSPCVKEKM